jgi:hypothetical protein
MDLSAKGLVLDHFSFVNFGAVFTVGRLLFEPRYFFDKIFWYKFVLEIKMNNFLVCDFLVANFMLVLFSLQSENNGILEPVLRTNTL